MALVYKLPASNNKPQLALYQLADLGEASFGGGEGGGGRGEGGDSKTNIVRRKQLPTIQSVLAPCSPEERGRLCILPPLLSTP